MGCVINDVSIRQTRPDRPTPVVVLYIKVRFGGCSKSILLESGMLGGGIADKVGNEYELRWTLVEALRVVRGLADEIRLEPFNEDAEGLEFRITTGGADEWHQCKRQRTAGSWTIRALTDAGVLSAFAGKLTSGGTCVFVSSDPAPAFEKLIEKALVADRAVDFYGEGGLGKGDEAALRELSAAWSVDAETQFAWLKRCRVEVTSDASLLRRLEEICELLFKTPASAAIDALARFLIGNLGQRLTTARLREAISELGIEWRAFLDATLDAKFELATDEYLNTLSTTIAGLELRTPGLDKAVTTAIEGDQPISVIAGGAGSGKSVALTRIIAAARQRGWPVLAFRIDRYLNIDTISGLGEALLETAESPVSAFGNRNAARPTLLVIDQVDAVSEASGRSGRIRELFFRMIDQTAFFPRMRVVAACRSYDLDGDTRLVSLSKAMRVTALRLEPLPWKEGVEPVLRHLGVDPARFSSREQQLLSTPVNLRLLADVFQAGEGVSGELSSTRLFGKLMEVRGRDLHQAGFAWTPETALGSIAQSMSENQDLTAPISALDAYPGAIDALASRGLITAVGGRLQFAHESFFDHSFSRRFTLSGQSVHSLLIGDEQRLFRRTQVRQIFSRLRDDAQRRYLQNLREVMEASDVRYLVKDAVGYWLGDVVAPTAAERSLVEEWFVPGHPLERLARIIFNGRGWLLTLHAGGTLKRWVDEGGTRKELAFWLLSKGAVGHSDLVAAFMRNWWAKDPKARAPDVFDWLEKLYPDGPIGEVEALYADVLEALPSEAIVETFAENFQLGSWTHKSQPLGARILGLWLRKWMAVFPDRHPFADDRVHTEAYWIDELAQHQPDALLDAAMPALAQALERERVALASGALGYPTIRPPHYEHDQEFLRSLIVAVETVASENPTKAEIFLEMLGDQTDVALYVRLRAIAANGAGLAHLLPPLLRHTRVFKIGDGHSDWRPLAKAAAAALPHLPDSARVEIETSILAYRPEYEWAREYSRREKAGELLWPANDTNEYLLHQLRLSGRDQRAILATIGADNLTPPGQKRLEELERKFPGQPLPDAFGSRGGFVRSPISPEIAKHMSDAQWLRAVMKYDGDDKHIYEPNGVIGGARELSSILQSRTHEEPERFVAFLERLPPTINGVYAEGVIHGLRESAASSSTVVRAIKTARRWRDKNFSRSVSWTVQGHPAAGVDPEVLGWILHSAEHGAASDTTVRTLNREKVRRVSASELLGRDDDLSSSGINGERGSAYEALATVLWDNEEALPAILELLERQVEAEPLASVRTCMARTINSVGKYDAGKAVGLLTRLVAKDLRVLKCHSAQYIVGWAVHDFADVIAGLVTDLLASKHKGLRAQGHFFESLLALLDEERNATFVAGFEDNTLRRQMAAYRGAGNVGSDRHGARAIGWLVRLFHDRSPHVRRDAVQINWKEILDSPSDHSPFVRAYLASPTFNEHSDHLMRALESRVSQWPDLTFDAVEKVLDLSGGWTDDHRRGHYSTMHHLSRVLIELYRSVAVGTDREKKILDLFDIYLARDAYDFRGELGAYERH